MAFDAAVVGDLLFSGEAAAAGAGAAEVGAGVAAADVGAGVALGVGADVGAGALAAGGGIFGADIAAAAPALAPDFAVAETASAGIVGGTTAGVDIAGLAGGMSLGGDAGVPMAAMAGGAAPGSITSTLPAATSLGGIPGGVTAAEDTTALAAGIDTSGGAGAFGDIGATAPANVTAPANSGIGGAPAAPTAASSAGGGWSSMTDLQKAGQGLSALSAGYGLYTGQQMMNLSKNQAKNADPFGPNRAQYGAQLNALMQNPNLVTNIPGYKFGLEQGEQGVSRLAAQQGLNLTPQQALEIKKYDQQYASQQFQSYEQMLANLAGANIQPTSGATALAGSVAGAQLTGSGLGTLGSMAGRVNSQNQGQGIA